MSKDALVVGINTYQYSGLADLQAPAEDAEAIAKRLEQDGDFSVWRLPEAISRETHHPFVGKTLEVKLPQLKKALVKLFKPEGNSIPDTALFYFSGHGLRTTLGIPEGFLATSDVNPDIEFNGLSLGWLRKLLRESPIKQQIVWLDCCHSGELLNFKQEADPGEQGKGRDRCFIAASREFEESYPDIGSPYSVLTKVLLQGLDPNRCPQRWVTNYSLVDYINQNLQKATQRPTFSNFGEPIELTRTWEVPVHKATSEPTQAICPYKGLEYFDCNEEDPKYFYGRKELTDQQSEEFPLSVEAGNFLRVSTKQQRNSRLKAIAVFLIIPLVGTVIISNELILSTHRQTLKNCRGIPDYCSGRIRALEALAKVSRGPIVENLAKADLSGANFSGANFSGADLSGADLSRAKLREADLTGADLSRAKLREADLTGADLTGAKLWGANLNGTDLTGTKLWGADLSGASLWNIHRLTPKQVKSACGWQQARFGPDFEEELNTEPDQQVDCSRWGS